VSVAEPVVGGIQATVTDENGKTGSNIGYVNSVSVGAFLNFSASFSFGVQLKPKDDDSQ